MTESDQHLIARLIRNASHAAYTLALGSARTGVYKKFTDPQPGDFVWESSTAYIPARDWHAVGRLLRIVQEPMQMEWNEAEDGPRPMERVWYIELLDGRESRWTNCEFLKVPDHARWAA